MSFSDWGGSGNSFQSNNPFGAPPSNSDDKDHEFQSGLQGVTEDIRQMTANFGAISSLTKSLGTGQDNAKLRDTLCVPLSFFLFNSSSLPSLVFLLVSLLQKPIGSFLLNFF